MRFGIGGLPIALDDSNEADGRAVDPDEADGKTLDPDEADGKTLDSDGTYGIDADDTDEVVGKSIDREISWRSSSS